MMAVQDVIILHGGELSSDIASRLEAKISVQLGKDRVKLLPMSSSREVKSILEAPPTTLAVFVAQTIENEAPPEDAGACVRFFKRRTHPADLLIDRRGGSDYETNLGKPQKPPTALSLAANRQKAIRVDYW